MLHTSKTLSEANKEADVEISVENEVPHLSNYRYYRSDF